MAQIDEKGFWVAKDGSKVHPDLIRADKKLEDELVTDMLREALEQQEKLSRFREYSFERVEGFIDLLLQNYNLDRASGSKKGATTLSDFSGLNKVEIAVANKISFDAKLRLAKLKIDEYLNEVTQSASPELKTLVLRAFDVDKKGAIDAKKILALKSYAIAHPKWQEALSMIDEATEIVGSKRYIRFYRRDNQEAEWEQIPLDLSRAKNADKLIAASAGEGARND
jgi:hypothetical protein